jgi:hypothetical protein
LERSEVPVTVHEELATMRLDELLEGVRLTGAGTLEGALVQRAVILSPRSPVHELQHQREPKFVGESPKSLVFQQVNDLTSELRRNAMVSTQALFDVAKWPVAVDERTGRHPRDAPRPPRTSCPLVMTACG